VESHRIQAELGHPRGHLVGRFVVGEVGAGSEIRAEEPQSPVAGVEVAILDMHETEFPGGLIECAADIGRSRRGVIPSRRERRQVGTTAGSAGDKEKRSDL
jgi:hypothetical protein